MRPRHFASDYVDNSAGGSIVVTAGFNEAEAFRLGLPGELCKIRPDWVHASMRPRHFASDYAVRVSEYLRRR